MEHSINKINGLGQLTATGATADPGAQRARTTEEVCPSGNLLPFCKRKSRMRTLTDSPDNSRWEIGHQTVPARGWRGLPAPSGAQGKLGVTTCPPGPSFFFQKRGLCPKIAGGQLKASVLELADWKEAAGDLSSLLTCLSSEARPSWEPWSRQARLGDTGQLSSFSAGEKKSTPHHLRLPACSCPATSQPFLDVTPLDTHTHTLTHTQSPRPPHTLSGYRPSITAMPARAVAGGSSFGLAHIRKRSEA